MSGSCRDCPACGLAAREEDRIARLEVNHAYRERLDRKAYELTYCACGDLIYLSPLPSDEDIRAMYVDSHQFGTAEEANSPYRGEQGTAVLEYTTSQLLEMLRSLGLDTAELLRVLEVGAGLAWMCRAAKIANWQNVTVAQDLTDEAVGECRWVDHYLVGDLLGDLETDRHGPFDIISLTHVIEHLKDPVAVLRRLAGMLSDRGLLFITAPHRPAGWTRGADPELWRGWSYNHVPAHIQYFARSSLERAAAAAGLELAYWSERHESGQAYEGWLRLPTPSEA